MLHGTVEGGGEEKAYADFVEGLFHDVGFDIEVKAEVFEAVGTATASGAGAVAVFGDNGTGTGSDKGDGSGDIEGDAAVAAGTDGVEGIGDEGLDACGAATHGTGSTGDFGDGFTFGGHSGEDGGDLCFIEVAGEDRVEEIGGFGFGEVGAGDKFGEERGKLHGGSCIYEFRSVLSLRCEEWRTCR